MYLTDTPTLSRFPITFNQRFFISGFAVLAFAVISPNYANAFSLFFTSADAKAVVAPYQSDPRTYLQAATNINPNPNKGLSDDIRMSGNAVLAYGGPSGTIADVEGSTPSDRISVYVVRPGDTLSDIANMFNVSVNTIMWANDLKGARDVHPGDTLIILPISGVERTIAKGDTLKSLAKKYGADADEIAQFNGLDVADTLAVGSTIIIPGGEIAAPVAAPRPQSSSPLLSSGGGSFIAGYFSNPVPGGRITQGIHGKNGIDIGAARGTPVHAAAGGTVIVARGSGWNGGYGNYVVISHDNGTQTLYSHLNSVSVSPGQSVSSGHVIGSVGRTGKVTGVHLHFEVRGASNPFRNCRIGSVCSPQ